MPNYSLQLDDADVFLAHLPEGANGYEAVVYEPAQIQFPGDVEPIEPELVVEGLIGQDGKLLTEVIARFPDQFQVNFPVNSKVRVIKYTDGTPVHITLYVDAAGQAIPVQGAGRRRRGTRRTKRRAQRRRSTRRNNRKH